MTLSLAAVFIPVLFMGGVLGRLFKEFAVTICVAILISGVVSVTLTPMLCSRFLRSAHEEKRSWFYRATEGFFQWMLRVYDQTLQIALKLSSTVTGIRPGGVMTAGLSNDQLGYLIAVIRVFGRQVSHALNRRNKMRRFVSRS